MLGFDFRFCPGCGILNRETICDFCQNAILKNIDRNLQNKLVGRTIIKKQYSIRYLFPITKSIPINCYQLLLAIKNQNHPEVIRFMSQLMVEAFFSFQSADCLWVPAPSSRWRNHSEFLANCLSEVAGKSHPPLVWDEQNAQKLLTLRQRSNRIMRPSPLKTSGSIVFVDDQVTTGQTIEKAFIALGKPKKFEAWAIVYNPLLPRQAD